MFKKKKKPLSYVDRQIDILFDENTNLRFRVGHLEGQIERAEEKASNNKKVFDSIVKYLGITIEHEMEEKKFKLTTGNFIAKKSKKKK